MSLSWKRFAANQRTFCQLKADFKTANLLMQQDIKKPDSLRNLASEEGDEKNFVMVQPGDLSPIFISVALAIATGPFSAKCKVHI